MENVNESTSNESSAMAKVFYALKNYNYKTLDYFNEKLKGKSVDIADAAVFEMKQSTIYEMDDERLEIFKPKDLDADYKPKNQIKGAGIIEFIEKHGHENICLITIIYDDGKEVSMKNHVHLLKKEPEVKIESKLDSTNESKSDSIFKSNQEKQWHGKETLNSGCTLEEIKDMLLQDFNHSYGFDAFLADVEEENGDVIYEIQSGKATLRIEAFNTVKITYENGKDIESRWITQVNNPQLIVHKLKK